MRSLFPNLGDVESALSDEEGAAISSLSRRGRGLQFGGANVSLYGPALLKKEMAEHSNILVNPNDANAPYPNIGYNMETGLEYDAADHEDTGLGRYETSAQEQEQEFEYGGEAEFDPQDDQWILGDYEESESDGYADEYEDQDSQVVGRYVERDEDGQNPLPPSVEPLGSEDFYSFEDHSRNYQQQLGAVADPMTAQAPKNNQTLRDGRNMGISIQPNIYKGADNGVYVTETKKEQIQESGVPVNDIRMQPQDALSHFESLPQFEFGRNFMGNRFAQTMTSFIGAEDRIQPNEMMPNPRLKVGQVDGVYEGSRIQADQGGGTARVVHGQRPQQSQYQVNKQQQLVRQPAQKQVLGASPLMQQMSAQSRKNQQSQQPQQRQIPLPPSQVQIVQPTQVIPQVCVVDIVDSRVARKELQAIQRCLSHMKRLHSNRDQIVQVPKAGNELVAFLDSSLKDNQWSEAIATRLKRIQHNISFLDSKNRLRLASVSRNNCMISLNKEAQDKFAPVCVTLQEDLSWFKQSIVKICEALCDKYSASADRMGMKKFASCPDFDHVPAGTYSLLMPSHSNIENAQISQSAKDRCAKQDCSHCVKIARVACLHPIYDARGLLKSEHCDFFEMKPIKQKVPSQPIIGQQDVADVQGLMQAARIDLGQVQSLNNPYIMQLAKCLVQDVRQQVISMQEAAGILRKQFAGEISLDQKTPYVLNESMKEFWGDSKLSKEEYATIKNSELKRLRTSQPQQVVFSQQIAPQQVAPQQARPIAPMRQYGK